MLRGERAYEVDSSAIHGLTSSAVSLFFWLLPYKIASEKLECERLSAAYIHPVINAAFELSSTLEGKYIHSDNVAGVLREAVNKRMFRTSTGAILSLLHLATPEGRYSYRLQFPEAIAGADSIIPSTDFSLKPSDEISRIMEMITTDEYSGNEAKLTTLYEEYEGILINPTCGSVVEHDQYDEDESILRRISSTEFEQQDDFDEPHEEEDDNEEDIDEPHEYYIDTSRGWLTVATNAITEISHQFQISDEKSNNLVDFFIKWITSDPKTIIAQPAFLTFGVEYWLKVLEDKEQSSFAEFIIPLLSLPACEGVCERAFWYQRRAIGDQRIRTGENTEIHRINYQLQRKN